MDATNATNGGLDGGEPPGVSRCREPGPHAIDEAEAGPGDRAASERAPRAKATDARDRRGGLALFKTGWPSPNRLARETSGDRASSEAMAPASNMARLT